MGEKSRFKISGVEVANIKYDIPFEWLIPFKPSDYSRGIFKTTVKHARERYSQYGITLENVEKKISEIVGVDYEVLKKYRETGIDELAKSKDTGTNEFVDDEPYSLEIEMEIFRDEFLELDGVYSILEDLELSHHKDVVELDVRAIKHSMEPHWYKNVQELFADAKEQYNLRRINLLEDFKEYDFFICHDSEDKNTFVEPLVKALKNRKIRVWYDKFVLKVGDSLIDKIEEGLKSCKYGIVVMSKDFIKNSNWPKNEFKSLKTRELQSGNKLILPIWRKGITKEDVADFNLELADRFALREHDGLKSIITALETKVRS